MNISKIFQKYKPKIYWIYILVFIFLIIYKFYIKDKFSYSDKYISNEQFTNLIYSGDIEKIVAVSDKNIVHIYIKKDSLVKDIYNKIYGRDLLKYKTNDAPLFKMDVIDWEKYYSDIDNLSISNKISEFNQYSIDEERTNKFLFLSLLLPILFWGGILITIYVIVKYVFFGGKRIFGKKCPHCFNKIKQKATVCEYCQSILN